MKKFIFRKRQGIVFLGILLTIVFLGLFIFIRNYSTIKSINSDTNNIINNINIDDFKMASTSKVLDVNGDLLFELKGDKDIQYLPYERIPKSITDSVIAIEDRRYMKHNGFDLISIMRAGLAIMKNDGEIVQGGSTITQQLAKNIYLTQDKTLIRKIKELKIAKELENLYTKEQILEFYINNIYYGNGAYGIASAASEYFSKDVSELTIGESAFLTAIPNNPTLYDPYTQIENTLERKDIILDVMFKYEFISEEEYNAAKEEVISINRETSSSDIQYDSRKSFVEEDLAHILMRKNGFKFKYNFKTDKEREIYIQEYYKEKENTISEIYRNGYIIQTSFDPSLQEEMQNTIDESFRNRTELNEDDIYKLQASSVVIDNKTGLIVGMVGGRTSPNTDYYNRAYQMKRQNGSTMKPIGVYGPALENGYTAASIINDDIVKNGPKNATGYFGDITLRKALAISSNTVADKIFKNIGPATGLKYLQEMEFSSIVPNDFNPPAALGGLTIGTSLVEVGSAYAALGNNGLWNRPSAIISVIDYKGEEIYKYESLNKRIYKDSTAFIITDILRYVVQSGTAAGSTLPNNVDVVGKTGTTDDYIDNWFVGYSPKYTSAVYVGYDIPQAMTNLYGDPINPSTIWHKIMLYLHEDESNLSFNQPDSVSKVYIDDYGKIVPDGQGRIEYFQKNNLPEQNKEAFYKETYSRYSKIIDEIVSNNDINTNEEFDKLKEKLNSFKNEISSEIESETMAKSINNYIESKLKFIKEKLDIKLNKPELPIETIEPKPEPLNPDENEEEIDNEVDIIDDTTNNEEVNQ